MALWVMLYPVLSRAACPCLAKATHPVQQQDSAPCHESKDSSKKTPPVHQNHTGKTCCAIHALDLNLTTFEINVDNLAQKQLHKHLLSIELSVDSLIPEATPSIRYQHYATKNPSLFTSFIPLYTRHLALLI